MPRNSATDIRSKSLAKPGVRLFTLTAIAALMVAAIALAANLGGGSATSNSQVSALLAQADPAPIVLEALTGRSVFTDDITMDINIGLQDGVPISMSVTDPGRSVVAKITVQPGAQFPWHTHPGPIVVNVAEGELVYIPANDCIERHYPAGTVFFDPGRGNVHTAYNASDGVTILMATFFEVPAEGPLTITEGITPPAGCDVTVGVHGDH